MSALKWKCEHCGELNRDHATACWVCQRPRTEGNEARYEEEELPRSARSEITTVVLGLATASICCGAFLTDPGLGILLSTTFIFPLLRTALVVSNRSSKERSTPIATLVLLFLSSMAVTWIILAVVGIAAIGTFCFTCMGVYDMTKNEVASYVISGTLATLVISFLGYFFVKWVRRRWRRDTTSR